MIRALVFDLDGVLVDSVEVKTQAFAKIFQHEEPDLVSQLLAYHLAHGGISRVHKFQYFYDHILNRALSEAELEHLCNRFTQLVFDGVANARWVDGAPEILEACKRQELPTFVVSGTPEQELRLIVARRNMTAHFRGVYGSPRTKPQLLRQIADDEGLDAREILFVGDARTDYEAAREVGVWFVARGDETSEREWSTRKVRMVSDLRQLHYVLVKLARSKSGAALTEL